MGNNVLIQENYDKLLKFIKDNQSDTLGLMPVLHEAQDIFGYIPLEVQKFISEHTGVSVGEIYGVVTFYSQFSTEQQGEHCVGVCLGTACYVKGAQGILERFKNELGIDVDQTTDDGKFTLKATRCLGACGLSPVATVDEDVYGKLTPGEVPDIMKKY